jgi:hypothetical protein
MVDPFEKIAQSRKESSQDPFQRIAQQRQSQKEDTRGLGERAKAGVAQYGTGVGGGAGGAVADVANLGQIPGLKQTFLGPLSDLMKVSGAKGTHELTEKIQKEFDVDDPKDSLERILKESGQWGGQEGTFGLATGGPVGGGLGLLHGSASGMLYGGLKELGMDDNWALGVTMLATVSPIAFEKLLPKIQAKLASKVKSAEHPSANVPGQNEPPPPGGGGTNIHPGMSQEGLSEKINENIRRIQGEEPPSPPPPGAPPGAGMQLAPEEAKITAPAQYLKSDYELAEDIQNALSPLKREETAVGRAKQPASVQLVFQPVSEELNQISPGRMNNPRLLGDEMGRRVRSVAQREYSENTRLWNEARDIASHEVAARPELAERLRTILRETQAPVRQGEKQLHDFAEQFLDRLERRRGRRTVFREVSNEDLINAIVNARKGYNYNLSGGVSNHRVNEFINAIDQELLASSSAEERVALDRARQAHRDWATRFKDPTVLPFRYEKLSRPRELYEKMLKPDTYHIISDILMRDPTGRGATLNGHMQRNMVEKMLEPYLLRPQSFNPAKFERDLSKLQGIIPDELLNQIGQKVFQHHEQSLTTPPLPGRGPSFANISESQIPSKLKTIEGLKRLKDELSQVSGGKELYEQVAKTQGIDLLFGGQLDIPAKSERIKNILNDRNGRPYIKMTLGEDNLAVLDDLVAKNQLEKRLTEIKESPTLSSILKDPDILVKGSKVVYNILRGNPIGTVNNSVQLAKKIAKHTKKKAPIETSAAQPNIEID